MPLDEEKRVRELRAWLKKTLADLEACDVLLASGMVSQLHQILFHCQQAVEKSLKSFLVWHRVPFRWTHDIGELGNQCIGVDRSLEKLVEQVKYLSDYAWEYRYPGEDPDPKKPEVEAGIKAARKAFGEVLHRFPSEVQREFEVGPTAKRQRSKKQQARIGRLKRR